MTKKIKVTIATIIDENEIFETEHLVKVELANKSALMELISKAIKLFEIVLIRQIDDSFFIKVKFPKDTANEKTWVH